MRAGLGVAFGAAFGVLVGLGGAVAGPLALPLGLAGLVPVRLLEWTILVRWFYDRRGEHADATRRVRWKGVACSFLLDVPAWAGLVKLGEAFVCAIARQLR